MRGRRYGCGLLAAMLLLSLCACGRGETVSRGEEGASSAHSSSVSRATSTAVTSGSSSVTAATTARTTTAKATSAATTPASAKDRVRDKLRGGRIAAIYKTTYQSLFKRLGADGYFQESVTGRYKGEYVRSIGALVKLALEAGETDAAVRALRFVTDTMTLKKLSYFPFTISRDKQTVRQEDELDGRAHLVLGWALAARQIGPSPYEDETYEMVAKELDAFFSDAYFYDESSRGLVLNNRFTHTRMRNSEDYWHCFDTLTNHFAAAAAENMIAVAVRRGDTERAARWQTSLNTLTQGIEQHLTRDVDGRTVYLELLDKGGAPEKGLSWVCLSPVAAGWSGLDREILGNTVRLLHETLWMPGGYLAVESEANGTVDKDWILGKSVGWDIDAARQLGDYDHIARWFTFLEKHHTGDLFMEKMKKSGGKWQIVDAGNGEQCIWFVWAIARLRRELGLPVQP